MTIIIIILIINSEVTISLHSAESEPADLQWSSEKITELQLTDIPQYNIFANSTESGDT